jgi:hypothetical protein
MLLRRLQKSTKQSLTYELLSNTVQFDPTPMLDRPGVVWPVNDRRLFAYRQPHPPLQAGIVGYQLAADGNVGIFRVLDDDLLNVIRPSVLTPDQRISPDLS